MGKTYIDAKINVNGTVQKVKIERGCSFENNGAIYRMNNDGKLSVYDKDARQWFVRKEIQMTKYQYETFLSVANNTIENPKGKHAKEVILSKKDIDKSLDMYKRNQLDNDLSENIRSGYDLQDTTSYSRFNGFSTYVTNKNNKTSATLTFKYGEATDAVRLSDIVHKNDNPYNNKGKFRNSSTDTPRYRAKDMSISNKGVNFIKKFESCRLTAYKCQAGVWTIGYGHTKGVKPGQKITKATAEKYLKNDIKEFENVVRKNVKVPISQNQFDALVSFAFNVGANNFKKSTLLKLLNKGDYEGAAKQFDKWVYANGQRSNGLIARRRDERRMFNTKGLMA